MPKERLELSRLAALASKTSVSAIPPLGHKLVLMERLELSLPKEPGFESGVSAIPPHEYKLAEGKGIDPSCNISATYVSFQD